MRKYYIVHLILIALVTIGVTGCTNLDERVYSEVSESNFKADDESLASLIASVYHPLTYIMDWQGLFDAQEESGDVVITPTRPNGWTMEEPIGVCTNIHGILSLGSLRIAMTLHIQLSIMLIVFWIRSRMVTSN